MDMLRSLTHIFFIHKRPTKHLMLVLILIVGFFVRINGFPSAVWSNVGYDESRDTLVASHLTTYGEQLRRGPRASSNYINNPPTYYYMYAFIWLLTKNIYLMNFLWIIFSLFTVYLSYKVGFLLWDNVLGLLFALLVAIHPVFIETSKLIAQPHLTPIFALSITYFLFKRPINVLHLTLVIALLFLGLHFHLSMILIIPIFGLSWFMLYVRMIRKQFRWGHAALLLCAASGLLLYVLLSYKNYPFDQIAFITNNSSISQAYMYRMNDVLTAWTATLTYHSSSNSIAVVRIMCFIYFAIFLLFFFTKYFSEKSKKIMLYILALNILPLFIAALNSEPLSTSYLIVILPFGILFFSYVLRVIIKLNAFIGYGFIVVLAVYFAAQTPITSIQPTTSYYQQMKNLASQILLDYAVMHDGKNEPYSFIIKFISYENDSLLDTWQTGGIWYHLEQMTGQKLVKLIDTGENFSPTIENPQHIYIICDQRIFDTFAPLEKYSCNSRIDFVSKSIQKETFLIYDHSPFMIFRSDAN